MQSLLSVFKENGNKRKESCSLFLVQKIAWTEEIQSLWDNFIVLMRDEWWEGSPFLGGVFVTVRGQKKFAPFWTPESAVFVLF